ncbi:MAG: hypothetical protein LBH44_11485 [Treponema sp.]|jgi:hypothetical protein|nr:hypothetical protein [Treponema sp.]
MEKIITNKIISVGLMFIFIFGLIPSAAFAQTNPAPSPVTDVKGFNRSVFDYHFSRADREIDTNRWLAEARLGMTQAICAWEFIASGLYENPFLFEEARMQIIKWSDEELEARFSQWLIGRFFGAAAEEAVISIHSMFDETQKNYSWYLDDDGNIFFDDKTGDPLIVRPGEDGREFSQDLLKWRGEAEENINTSSLSFENILTLIYPELLVYIPVVLRATMGAVIHETGVHLGGLIKTEFENIAAREERIFTSRRTRDIWSLRKKSDDEAARIFTERLISETETVCARGIEELTVKIEEASAGTGDLAIMGEEWLRLYKEQFERGLKAWEDAEERFFMRRIEWEQESFRLYSEGEEIWLTAFREFENERQRWELTAKELFESGELLFKNLSETLERSIAETKKEFEYNMTMRIGAGTAKAQALINMYLTCCSAAITAKENIQFWQKQYSSSSIKNPKDLDFQAWLEKERKNIWIEAEDAYINQSAYLSLFLNAWDVLRKADVDSSVKVNAEKNYRQLLEEYIILQNDLSLIRSVNTGNLTLARQTEIAKKITNSDLFRKKDFETLLEMEKSYNLYVSYNAKAIDVRNRILTDYNELIVSGALKDILSPDASSEDFCLDEYQIELIRAKTLVLYWERKTSIAEAVMNYAQEIDAGRMTDAEGVMAWENAKTAYDESVVQYENELKKLNDISADIHEKQIELDRLAEKMKEAEFILDKLTADYSSLVAASIINRESFLFQEFNAKYKLLAEEYRKLLITGNEAIYVKTLEYGVKWGIAEQKEEAEKILALLINGDDETLFLSELRDNFPYGIESEIDKKIRLAAIDLFADNYGGQLRSSDSKYSGADWYFKAKGIIPTTEAETLYGENLNARLMSDYKNSYGVLVEKRIELELNALNCFLNGGAPGSNGYALSKSCKINDELAAKAYQILTELKERLYSGKEAYTDTDEENKFIGFFLSGNSFFTESEKYLTDYINDYYLCLGLLNLYNNYAAISSFGQNEIWQNSLDSLKNLYDNYDLDSTNFLLPKPQTICESILYKSGDFIQNAAQFLLEFENCFLLIPEWFENELINWKRAVIEYIGAYAFFYNLNVSFDVKALELEYEGLMTEWKDLSDYANSLNYLDDDEIAKINDSFTEIIKKVNLINCRLQITGAWDKCGDEMNIWGKEKHWRSHLTRENLEVYDRAIISASSWKEGMMLDALDSAVYFSNCLNDAIELFSQRDNIIADGTAKQFYDFYRDEVSRNERYLYILKSEYGEISRLGGALEISRMSAAEAKKKLDSQYDILKTQESIHKALTDEYLKEAENFLDSSNKYDNQYSILKKKYEDMEKARFEYELQDAIRRWASTAYLSINEVDPDYCRNKLEKAKMVLTVLSDIYNNEKKRPYVNAEYNALFSEYEKSFQRKLLTLEALEAVLSATEKELINNEKILAQYEHSLYNLGGVDQKYSNYTSPGSRASWTVKDIITVKDGRLAFSKDDSMRITGVNASSAKTLDEYFNKTVMPNGERNEISLFDEALRELSQRMTGYFTDYSKFKQWSYARDYLLSSLIKANSDINFLKNCYSGLGQMKKDGSWGVVTVKGELFDPPESLYSAVNDFVLSNYDTLYRWAWDGLSKEEKADLEFYVILTLSGKCNDYIKGFSLMHTFDVYSVAHSYVNDKYKLAQKKVDEWWLLPNLLYFEMRDINKSALSRISPGFSEAFSSVLKWQSGLINNLDTIKKNASEYIKSCNALDILEGKKEAGQSVGWNEINAALRQTRTINSRDIATLKTFWDKMQSENNGTHQTVYAALDSLIKWADEQERKSKNALEKQYLEDEEIRQQNEIEYHKAVEGYIAGTISIETLRNAAEKAFGQNAPAWKNHFGNIQKTLLDNFSLYVNSDNNFYKEYYLLGNEIILMTANTLENRYMAEFAAREIEWNQMRQDIREKHLEWRNSAANLLEAGRMDWSAGIKKMEDAYKQWNINFQNEYNRVSDEWAEAYLAGLEDKEKWLEQAAEAANQASAESFLLLVGTEGERLARFMDTREPFGIRNAAPVADDLMSGLLQASGIVNMAGAFGSLNNVTPSPLVRRGMGGVFTGDAALVKAAASDLARKTNAEIAERESRKLARSAGNAVDEAMKNLASNVESANNGFRENMDDTFILNGLWRRSGKDYVKDIIMGSTLFQPVVSETKKINGYRDYRMEKVTLKTNLDENYLATLNSLAVIGLIENAFSEIEDIVKETFGIGKDPIKIKKKGIKEEREQSPGKFGVHLGYSPAMKPSEEMDSSRDSMFYDEGKGEIGRLITEYTYWLVTDSRGNAELGLPFWDKPMWDDRDSFFKAPTIRSTVQIAGAIAASVITGGSGAIALGTIVQGIRMSTAGDLVFAALDFGFGYKTIDEAAFNLGKALTINTVSSFSSGLFNGISNGDTVWRGLTDTVMNKVGNSTAGIIAAQTAMAGVQSITTTLATSAFSGITYNRDDGWGYSTKVFNADSIVSGALTSMATALTSGTLKAINSGINEEKLSLLLTEMEKENISKFNELAGSLVGQGVNYAMGGDFTLNVLNLSLFTGGEMKSGLLELHLGHDGASMNIGTGGANVSIDNLINIVKGAMAWNRNNEIVKSTHSLYLDMLNELYASLSQYEPDIGNPEWDTPEVNLEYSKDDVVQQESNMELNRDGVVQQMDDMTSAPELQHENDKEKYIPNVPLVREQESTKTPEEFLEGIAQSWRSLVQNSPVDDSGTTLVGESFENWNPYVECPEGAIKAIYDLITDPETRKPYLPETLPNGDILYKCLTFFIAMNKQYLNEDGAYNTIFNGWNGDTKQLYDFLLRNNNLEPIPVPDANNLLHINEMVKNGDMVVQIVQGKDGNPGHIALVVPREDLKLGTFPEMKGWTPDGKQRYQGMMASQLPAYELAVLHAGAFPGASCTSFTTTKWTIPEERRKQLNESMFFFRVRR